MRTGGRLATDAVGVTQVEYVLCLALVAVALLFAWRLFGDRLGGETEQAGEAIASLNAPPVGGEGAVVDAPPIDVGDSALEARSAPVETESPSPAAAPEPVATEPPAVTVVPEPVVTEPPAPQPATDDRPWWQRAADGIAGAADTTMRFGSGAGRGFANGAVSTWNGITGFAGGVYDAATHPAETWQSTQQFASDAWDATQRGATAVADGAERFWNDPAGTTVAAWEATRDGAVAAGEWAERKGGEAIEWAQNADAEQWGELAGGGAYIVAEEVVVTVGTAGIGHLAKARYLGRLAHAAETIDDVADATRAIDHAGDAARAADHAGDAARVADDARAPRTAGGGGDPDGPGGGVRPDGDSTPPAAAATRRITTGLGSAIDDIVAQSPRLQRQIDDATAAGYRIRQSPAGRGAWIDRATKEVFVDTSLGPEQAGRWLSHELGHANYPFSIVQPRSGMTRQQFVDQNLHRHLIDEGEAFLSELEFIDNVNPARVRAGEAPIPFRWRTRGDRQVSDRAWRHVYDDYRSGRITREEARERFGQVAWDHETSSQSGTLYRDAYRAHYEREWDRLYPQRSVAPGAEPPVRVPDPDRPPPVSGGAASFDRSQAAHDAITHDLYHGRAVDAHPFSADRNRNSVLWTRIENPRNGRTREALFKPREWGDGDGWNNVTSEYSAYSLNRMLGMDYVPPTAYRRGFDASFTHHAEGSLSYLVPDAHPLRRVRRAEWGVRPDVFLSDTRVLDVLIQNPDRHAGNFLRGRHWVDGEYRPVLIDHGAAFRRGSNVRLDQPGALGTEPITVVRRSTLDYLRRLDGDRMRRGFGEFTSDREIRNILRRRDQTVEYFEELIRRRGEENVVVDVVDFARPPDLPAPRRR